MRSPNLWAVFATCLVLLALPETAGAVRLSWSGAMPVLSSMWLGSIACPAENQCTAIAGEKEVTFDPHAPASPTPVTIDSSPGRGLSAIACPATTECAAVDGAGQEVTFNPLAPGTPTPVQVDPTGQLTSLFCVSVSLCLGGDDYGGEAAFNPTSPTAGGRAVVDSGGWQVEAVSCPSAVECVAVDQYDGAMTFDPADPGAPQRYVVDSGGSGTPLFGVACPSTSLCIATESSSGRAVMYDPLMPSREAIIPIDPGVSLNGVTCLPSECLIVDAAGRVFVGNLANPRTWTIEQIAGRQLVAVSCASLAVCVVVDDAGNAYVGLSAPITASPPTISGQVALGQTLTESHGAWLGSPTGYAYQWRRCATNGLTCTPVEGATTQTYTVTTADAGATLRVQETATNTVGTSGAATSTPTAPVTAPSSGGGGGSPPSSPPPPGTPSPRVTSYRIAGNGTLFKYILSEAASVRIAISQRLPGRQRGHRCVAPSRRLRPARPCSRNLARRTLSRTGRAGANTITTSALRPGRYEATLIATDAAGRTSRPLTVAFTVKSR